MWSLGSATCAPNFAEIGTQVHRLCTLSLFGAKKKKKNTVKIRQVSGICISGTGGAISFKLGNNVVYMRTLKYIDLVLNR